MNPYDPHRATASPTPSAVVGADPLLPPADAEHEPSPIDLAEQSVAGEEDPGAAYGDEPLWPAGAANGRDTGAPDAGAAPGAARPSGAEVAGNGRRCSRRPASFRRNARAALTPLATPAASPHRQGALGPGRAGRAAPGQSPPSAPSGPRGPCLRIAWK